MMTEWRVFGGFPTLMKFWGEEAMTESASVIDGCTTASAVCSVSQSVCSPWRSVPIIKKLHLVLPTGTDMTTCPCTGTCSAVGPSDQSNTCSRNKPSQFLPSYNLREAALCFYYHRHTLLWQTVEIYSINLWIKCPNLKQNLAKLMRQLSNFEVN